MVSMFTLLVTAGLSFQSPPPVQTADGLRPASAQEISSPNPVITPELRGDIMVARKMYREAIDFYKPGANTNAVLANKAGIAYQILSDLDNAKKYYERAVKLKPDYAEAINNLGTVYYAEKSYRRAINQYHKALRLSPRSATTLSNLGTALFARNQLDEAIKVYQQAVAIDPDVLDQRGTQGVIVQQRNVEEKAKFYYALAKTFATEGATDRTLLYIRRALEQGFKERDKFLQEPEFAFLQDNAEFKEILAAEHKVL
jgi:tetratricopeptide (TPR) repeat protein